MIDASISWAVYIRSKLYLAPRALSLEQGLMLGLELIRRPHSPPTDHQTWAGLVRDASPWRSTHLRALFRNLPYGDELFLRALARGSTLGLAAEASLWMLPMPELSPLDVSPIWLWAHHKHGTSRPEPDPFAEARHLDLRKPGPRRSRRRVPYTRLFKR